MFRTIVTISVLTLGSVSANAAILGRLPTTSGGTDYQAYYDTVLKITWLADANLADVNTFGVMGIAADGAMNWPKTNEWIVAMNGANFLGKSDWRLPTLVDTGNTGCEDFAYTGTDCGYNVQTMSGSTVYSEIAYLYHVTLGNTAAYDTGGILQPCNYALPSYCLISAGPFSNV